MGEWFALLKKAGRRSFLGYVDTRWRILRERNGVIVVSQRTAKCISSLIGLLLIAVGFLVYRFQVSQSIESGLAKFGPIFIIVCSCLYFAIDLTRTRQISWKKGGSDLQFTWGFYPFLRTAKLKSNGLKVELRNLSHGNKGRKSNPVGLFLISPLSDCADIFLAKGRKQRFVLPVFEAMAQFLGKAKNPESS